MRLTGASVALLLLWAVVAAAEQHCRVSAGAPETAIEAAIGRALGWVTRHPASVQDGGIEDMIDEGLSFFVLHNIASSQTDRAQFLEMMRMRLSAVARQPELEHWVRHPGKTLIDHYHLVLAAHLMRVAGEPSTLEPAIVAQAQRALAGMPGQLPTVRLTLARLLQYLGENIDPLMDSLLSVSVIGQIGDGRLQVNFPESAPPAAERMISFLLYALVHETAALVDFGRLPPTPWLTTRRGAVLRTLSEGVGWARALGDVDLLSELMVTSHLLGKPANEQWLRGKDLLLATQHADGSWGASSTTHRRNKVRHAVLTSIAALWVYGEEQDEQ